MKKLVYLLGALTALFSLSACAGSAQPAKDASAGIAPEAEEVKEYVVGISGTFNPYCYLDEDGNPAGFDVEFLKAVEAKIPGVSFKFEPMEFNSLIVALESGKIDLISHQMGKNEEREAKFTYPEESYINSVISIVVHEDTEGISTLDDLQGRKVALYSTSSAAQLLQEYNEKNPENPIEIVFTETEGVLLVANQTVDATITQPVSVKKFQDEQGLKVKVVGEPVNETPVYQVFRKDETLTDFISQFDQAVKELRESGSTGQLSEEVLGGDYTG